MWSAVAKRSVDTALALKRHCRPRFDLDLTIQFQSGVAGFHPSRRNPQASQFAFSFRERSGPARILVIVDILDGEYTPPAPSLKLETGKLDPKLPSSWPLSPFLWREAIGDWLLPAGPILRWNEKKVRLISLMPVRRCYWTALIYLLVFSVCSQAAPPEGPALPLLYLKPAPEPPGPSSRRSGIVLSEVMYHPGERTDGRNTQFVEVFNSQVFFEDLSGWSLQGDVQFTFPTNSVLPARSHFLVAANPADFRLAYPDLPNEAVTPIFGPFEKAKDLPTAAGTIRLLNRLGAVVFELHYEDDARWPVAANGGGHSLVLSRPSYGERDPYAWGPSETSGGSPGRLEPVRTNTPLDAIVINELLAHTETSTPDFVELYNYSENSVDLSGCILTDDPATDRFKIPAGTSIPARGHLAWDQDALGFSLNAAGERLFLFSPDRSRVIDALTFEAQEDSVSWGRFPDGAARFSRLKSPTPGQPNILPVPPSVVLNEIMYHPSSELDDDQYVELHNPGTNSIDLSGWRLMDGIRYTFPTGASIPPDGFVVVAKNLNALASNYPGYNPKYWYGDFSGALSGAGERLALTKPATSSQTNQSGTVTTTVLDVVVDEVAYGTGGRWGRWSDGGGSSLERRDPLQDGRLAANWGDSDESQKSSWVEIKATGPADLGSTSPDAVQILAQGAGEYLIDDVVVQVGSGTNRVVNSSFASGVSGWTFQGNHLASSWEATEGAAAPGSLRLRAGGPGTTGPNRAFTRITAIAGGSTVNMSAKVRWLRGAPTLLVRIKGNYLEIPGIVLSARNLGTPGAPNTIRRSQSVPNISEVSHFPILPRAAEIVRVTARIADPLGLDAVVLRYHTDGTAVFNELTMTNSGAGWYSAELPALSGFQQFHIVATNVLGKTTLFPADAPERECNIRYGDPIQTGILGGYRMWVSKTNVTRWTKRHALANDPLDTTFVYSGSRVIYNAGSQYSGSPYHAPSYNSPTGSNCDYVVVLPADDVFLGETELNLLQPGNGGGDSTGQAEQHAYWIADQLGLPSCYRRPILVWFNGVKRGAVFEDCQQPNRDFVREWYPDDDGGDLRKIQLWFEFETDGVAFGATGATLDNFVSQGKKKMARYRWIWPSRSFGNDPNNYTNLYALVDSVNTRETGDRYTRVLEQATDVDEWFRTHVVEHLVGNGDSYSYGGGQNMYAYKPNRNRWQLLIWDIDFAFNASGPTTDMTGIGGANVGPVNTHPPFTRKYYQAMIDAVQGPLEPSKYNPILDARYNGMRTNGAAVTSPSNIKSFLRSRHDYMARLIVTNTAPLALSTSIANGITTTSNLVTLSGTAPLQARSITVDGRIIPVTWTSRTNWTARVPFPSGTSEIFVSGLDGHGQSITNSPVSLKVTVNSAVESPVGRVLISEILPSRADELTASWIELNNISSTTAFDVSGWRIEGLDYTAPPGTVLTAGGRLVIPSSRYLFGQTYGPQLPVAGEFAGRLDPDGETLRLVKPGLAGQADQIINELRYNTSAPWPDLTPGTSLQLIDASQDNRRAANWLTASTTNAPAGWLRAAATGTASSSTVYLYLENSGDVYVDDWALVAGSTAETGPNLIPGGDFEGAFPGAFIVGSNHSASATTTNFAHTGNKSLHLIANSAGSTRASAITIDLPTTLLSGAEYTISFWFRPKAGGGLLTSRLSGNGVKVSVDLQLPSVATTLPSTPGAVNTGAHALPPLASLAINEIMPVNTATLRDNLGRYRPWVELHNASASDQPLTDFFLSPNPTNLGAWRFPDTASVPAKGFLIVWLDGDLPASTAAAPHTGFSAGASGTVILSQRVEGRIAALDQLNYESPGPDRAIGDIPDGDILRRHVFTTSTPNLANTLVTPAIHVFINEWVADNASGLQDPSDGDAEDWFELYNAGNTPVNLAGFYLSNSRENPKRFRIPTGYLIPAGGHLLVWADDETDQNQAQRPDLHVDFKLSKSGETIVFADPDGQILDSVTFGSQVRNVSQGREPDGGNAIGSFSTPTPGASNPAPAGPARINSVVLENDQIGLLFTGSASRRYEVQSKIDFGEAGDTWTAMGSLRTDALGQGLIRVARLPGDVRFYRVRGLPGDL